MEHYSQVFHDIRRRRVNRRCSLISSPAADPRLGDDQVWIVLEITENPKMQTRLLSLAQVCKAVKRSHPYVRALADSGVIDSYVASSGWRAFPRHAIEQVKQHEAQKALDVVDA
jgi:hypothetical protein